ncbi:YqiA/YcfP family alpha/beta fold hydrolase [Psychrobacter sp. M13]|uniref:YqiA/YcfP family alpha/beta fold hydrolase n=1 Tax=Psychrobacter sp. M13 TaxID=3067275 RepID=UPI00273BEFE2|nr:YqiA/YcfP family alpha/beta fold hydrolase [Psychrobacter sp. M13]WLP94475.1 YqiA/YcfP family alpha/beta fold hydrolase [Psychrobacter sp. M13]
MNLIYIHGLDSDANSTKGLLLDEYCQQHHPDISVHRPDLNQPPQVVFDKLVHLVEELGKGSKVVLVGSSLGGYFATLVSNQTGCPALLINPSTQPHITLQRFDADKGEANALKTDSYQDRVLHTTDGGWALTKADLQWFTRHTLSTVENPSDVEVMIKKGDELLDANLSAAFYRQQGATVTLQAGGDHRFSDFEAHLPQLLEILKQL